jgi:hypothetical protein
MRHQLFRRVILYVVLGASHHLAAAAGAASPVFLGNHVFYAPSYASTSKSMFSGVRLWASQGTTWRDIQPTADEFNFSALDAHVNSASAKGFEIVLTLGQTPRWASSRPNEGGNMGMGAAAEPREMSAWAKYVFAVVSRYQGRIAAYEVMNEPRVPEAVAPWSPGFFSGSAGKLVEMTRITRDVVRSIDPKAKIICPSMDGAEHGLKRLAVFLAEGGGEYCDVIGFHLYLSTLRLPELRHLIGRIQQIMVKYGVGDKPLWNTETGILVAESGNDVKPKGNEGAFSRVFDGPEAARFAGRYIITSHALGVQRTYWFAHDCTACGSLTPNKKQGRLNALGIALQELNGWLADRTLQACSIQAETLECRVVTTTGEWVGTVYWGEIHQDSKWSALGFRQVRRLDGTTVVFGEPARSAPRTREQVDEPVFVTR